MIEKGWKRLGYQTTYRELPAGLRLDGRYRALGGTGNLAAGGNDSVAVRDEYRFSPDGSVLRTGGAGGSSAFGNASVATVSQRGPRRGRYRVEGLMLVADYAGGGSERRVLVVDPNKPGGALWLDGAGYARRK